MMHEKSKLNGYRASVNYEHLFIQIFRQKTTEASPNLFVNNDEANFSLHKKKFSVLKYRG